MPSSFSSIPLFDVISFSCLVIRMDRAKLLGPILKLVLCICVLPVLLILWPVVGIAASIVGGAAYGFLSPIFATFDAVGEGRSDQFFHCIYVSFIVGGLILLVISDFLHS